MTVVGNFNFSYFLRLTWKFLGLKSERGGSVCWLNNKIIDDCKTQACENINFVCKQEMIYCLKNDRIYFSCSKSHNCYIIM